MKIRMGQFVKDKASGFTGHIDSIREILDGNIQYCVRPNVNDKGEMQKGFYMDPFMLTVLNDGYADDLPDIDKSVTLKLGDEVEDTVSGFRGIVTEKHTSQNGCVSLFVVGRYNSEESTVPNMLELHTRFKRVKAQVQPAPKEQTPHGAPMMEARDNVR